MASWNLERAILASFVILIALISETSSDPASTITTALMGAATTIECDGLSDVVPVHCPNTTTSPKMDLTSNSSESTIKSTTKSTTTSTPMIPLPDVIIPNVVAIVVVPIVVLFPLGSIVLFIVWRRNVLRELNERGQVTVVQCDVDPGLPRQTHSTKTTKLMTRRESKFAETLRLRYVQEPKSAIDRWEIGRSRVTMGERIGKGAFGYVCIGTVDGTILAKDSLSDAILQFRNRQVAVKMLSENATADEQAAFRKEIQVMKDIGYHKHIISLIGCCTTTQPVWLIEEFCPFGDLRKYLKDLRELAAENLMNVDETNTDIDAAENDNTLSTNVGITLSTLLSYARQIAIGMEYLHQKGYVHRDLAARNVLISDRSLVKICDFGLARFLQDDQLYAMQSTGKLPVKWMAIESLYDHTFTTATDVWSFGIVLFEIITLGGIPYPTIENRHLISQLRNGYRMECPDNCPPGLYSLMLSCWQFSPKMRPPFSELKMKLEQLLEASTELDTYLQLDNSRDYYVQSSHVPAAQPDRPVESEHLQNCLQLVQSEREF